jgi:hypothetical protein
MSVYGSAMFSQIRSRIMRLRSTIWKRIGQSAVLTMVALLASCIDGREEYWFTSRGEGRADIQYTIASTIALMEGGDAGIRKSLNDFFENTPTIRHAKCLVETRGRSTRVQVNFDFESALDLMEASRGSSISNLPSAVGHLVGEMEALTHGQSMEVTRTRSPDKAIPGAPFLPKSSFEDKKLVCIVHLPSPARESNADQITDGGKTLRWDTDLAATLGRPQVMSFKVNLPIPWTAISASGLGLATVLILALLWRRRRQGRAVSELPVCQTSLPKPR